MKPDKSPSITSMGRRGRMTDRFSQTDKPKNSKRVIGKLWDYFKYEKSRLCLLCIAVLVQVFMTLMAPRLIGQWVDKIDGFLQKGWPLDSFKIIYQLIGIYLISAVAIYGQGFIVAGLSQGVMLRMRQTLMDKLTKLPIEYYDKHTHGNIMSRFTNDVENVSASISESLSELVSSSLIMTGALIMMVYLSWQLTLATLLLVPMIFLISKIIAKISRPLFKARANSLGALSSIVEESVSGLSVVQAFNQESTMESAFEAANDDYLNYGMKAQIAVGFLMPMVHVIYNMSFAVVAFLGGYLVLKSWITIGAVMSFIAYSRQFIRPLNHIASIYSALQSALASSERLFEFLTVDDERSYGTKALSDLEDTTVVFEEVSFSYSPGRPVIRDINFSVSTGKKIALVGPTGAGKTTLVNLLSRFYQTDSGRITIGGCNINDFETHDFYRNFGIVLQEPYLFQGTIKENIQFGNLLANEAAIVEALKAASCWDFVSKLPEGIHASVSKAGANISQGQKQLLTIARAIVANPKILILDEATSNVDTRTEGLIQKAMMDLMQGRTSFIIAHRLSTIRDADQILVIEDGGILETGNHRSLMAARGHYYQMIKHQYNNESIEETS